MSTVTTAYIGLGSNLNNPINQVQLALYELQELPDTVVIAQSALYGSVPLGPADQPDYVNAVASVRTALSALALLDALQALELRHNRVRIQRWGPRTLDLDMLLFGDQVIQSDRLSLPHPELVNRRFVLQPLAEVAPALRISGVGYVQDLLAVCVGPELKKIVC